MLTLPNSSIRILGPFATLDYFDTQTVILDRCISPLEAWNMIMSEPQPALKLAFQIRDRTSSHFGVRSINGFSRSKVETVSIGDRLDFFLVEYCDAESLVLTDRDVHLDVMTCISSDGSALSVTSSVRTHNWFGRAYMVPVGIAHKWIVRGMLKRLRERLRG